MISKIKTKLMRLSCRFNLTRNIGISLKKSNSKIKEIKNKDFDIDVESYLSTLNKNGFSQTFSLPENYLNSILDYAKSATFKGLYSNNEVKIDYGKPMNPNIESDLWYLDKAIYKNCETVHNLAHDKNLVAIARQYLGKEPKVYNAHAWWSFPPKNEDYSHTYGYHYDIDALKFVKFFIYLTDVDENSGPHVIISNTHKSKNWFEKINRRLTDAQVEDKFKKEDVNIMTAKAGQGFFEDTFSYHKGTIPKKPRLILQVEYTI